MRVVLQKRFLSFELICRWLHGAFGIGGAGIETPLEPSDWGSALAVRVPTILQTAGSSQYAPQEQFLGSPPNPRDDVFALGIIAYQMVKADTNAIPD